VVLLISLFLLFGCDELVGGGDNDGDCKITDLKAIAGMEIAGELMDALFEGADEPPAGETFPDFENVTYPPGMTVEVTNSSELSVTFSVTAKNLSPEADDDEVAKDVKFDADFTIFFSTNSKERELTVEMDGTIEASGTDAPFTTLTVSEATAMFLLGNEGIDEPESVSGTLTIDGTSYDMSKIDTEEDSGEDYTNQIEPKDAHYFLMSYWVDGETDRPQVVYSANGDYWGALPLQGEGRLRAGAIDENGLMVVVGENGLIFTSSDGATWTRRADGTTTNLLNTVEWNGSEWIAAGEEVILRSTDGISWSKPEGPA